MPLQAPQYLYLIYQTRLAWFVSRGSDVLPRLGGWPCYIGAVKDLITMGTSQAASTGSSGQTELTGNFADVRYDRKASRPELDLQQNSSRTST
jgi:hypothetical protein